MNKFWLHIFLDDDLCLCVKEVQEAAKQDFKPSSGNKLKEQKHKN